MTQKHQRSRRRRYSSRDKEWKHNPPETECLNCHGEIKNRGSELCDECELKYLGRS